MKRVFDILLSFVLLVLLSPILACIAIIVSITSTGGPFFGQQRVGRNFAPFTIWKFRTMRPGSESAGQITVGKSDARITPVGKWLRKYKLDELPQLWNVLIGEMSLVGPRPEVPKYVEKYNQQQQGILNVRPGITDYASLEYFEESELLAKAVDAEECYIKEIMPAKLELNLRYIEEQSFLGDLRILWSTIMKMMRA